MWSKRYTSRCGSRSGTGGYSRAGGLVASGVLATGDGDGVGLRAYNSAGAAVEELAEVHLGSSGLLVRKWNGGKLPVGHVRGLRVVRAGNDTVDVETGTARSSTDNYDLTLAAITTATVTTAHGAGDGLPTINGLDEIGLDNLASGAITCAQGPASTTITTTGSVLPYLGSRAGSGTIEVVGQDVTGSSTRFLSELAPNDLVGTTAEGWARVISVESDTAATISAVGLPGGAVAAGAAYTIRHQAFVRPGTPAAGVAEEIESVSAAGTTILVGTSATHGAGSEITVGAVVGTAAMSGWLAVWVVSDGTTTGLLLSTQHETLLGASEFPYARRVGWARRESSAFLHLYYDENAGPSRRATYEETAAVTSVLVSGSALSWTAVSTASLTPRTTRLAICGVWLLNSDVASQDVYFRSRARGSAGSRGRRLVIEATSSIESDGSLEIPVSLSGSFEYYTTDADVDVYVSVVGFADQL